MLKARSAAAAAAAAASNKIPVFPADKNDSIICSLTKLLLKLIQ